MDDGSRHGNALLLTARQFRRSVSAPVGQTNAFSASMAWSLAAWGERPLSNSGSSTFSTAERTGRRLKSWKINPKCSPLKSVRASSEMPYRGWPFTNTMPEVGSSIPDRMFNRLFFRTRTGPSRPPSPRVRCSRPRLAPLQPLIPRLGRVSTVVGPVAQGSWVNHAELH